MLKGIHVTEITFPKQNNRNSPSPPTEDSEGQLAAKSATCPAKLLCGFCQSPSRRVGKPGLKWLLPMWNREISSSCKPRSVFWFKIINSYNHRALIQDYTLATTNNCSRLPKTQEQPCLHHRSLPEQTQCPVLQVGIHSLPDPSPQGWATAAQSPQVFPPLPPSQDLGPSYIQLRKEKSNWEVRWQSAWIPGREVLRKFKREKKSDQGKGIKR